MSYLQYADNKLKQSFCSNPKSVLLSARVSVSIDDTAKRTQLSLMKLSPSLPCSDLW